MSEARQRCILDNYAQVRLIWETQAIAFPCRRSDLGRKSPSRELDVMPENWFRNRPFCLPAGLACLLATRVFALDVILDPAQVSRQLALIDKLHADATTGSSLGLRLEALYQLGAQAVDLTDLMNKDLETHGSNDPSLIALILTRLKRCGIAVQSAGGHFKYDLAAFHEYLRQAPKGKRAADACFALLANEEKREDAAGIQELIEEKHAFVRDYPNYPEMAMMKLLVAQDHLHLSRLYESQKNRARSEQEHQIAWNLYREIVRRYPKSLAAEVAADNLSTVP